MKNYVLFVFIWCGFAICPYRAQDIYKFYPSSSDLRQPQRQVQANLHTSVPRQIQYETQPISRKDQFSNEAGSVTYFNNAQESTKSFGADPIAEIIRQIIGPEAIIQSLSSYGNNQQNALGQFQVPAPQGYSFTILEGNAQGNSANNLQPAQRSSQFQNIVVPSQDEQNPRITSHQNQVLSNGNPDRERYTVFQKDEQSSNSQNENSSQQPQISEPTSPTKKPLYLNRFAADLYITRKPCEMCCKDGDVEPCTRCCDVIPLLNAKTLKIVTG